MTKIKNFRVTLRPREMARWLKRERAVETTPELEVSLEQLAKESRQWVSPAAVYTTLTHQTAEKTTSIPLPKNAVALSIAVVSIGSALQGELARAGDPAREMLLSALFQESLSQSLAFTVRLLTEQARDEDCEVSPAVVVAEEKSAAALASLAGVARIGIDLDAAACALPSYVRVAYTFWTPIGKTSSRRAEPAGRAEKVAA